MTLRVIGLGLGRTGTFSMKFALEHLGFGPCHHMEEVDPDNPDVLALWNGLALGKGDIRTAYAGFNAAVDWPTAAFGPELYAAYPDAKFLLTQRDPEAWYSSFSQTIYPLDLPGADVPEEMRPFLGIAAFRRHGESVRALIPADQLLIHEVSHGWEPLCRFLDVPVPNGPYPRSNNHKEFWESVKTGKPPHLE
jgi:hypothetical protein